MKLSKDIIHFFEKQGFVIVSTLDESCGSIHCSAKGIGSITPAGKIYLIDLYRSKTFRNLQANSTVSLTAVDEHHFIGYTLKGKARIIEREKIKNYIIKQWEERVTARISRRLIKNVRGDKRFARHPEARFPAPQYLIVVEVTAVVDLAPGQRNQLPKQ
ncbi:MAG: pyridoxamine 5'-phosphate oxidase family protein [Candidatus Omnitrophota bacterium]|nr:pyridoxamine 5'-phosphate oxidase family protein [Candidatus Omnitrophota bacterium]